MTATSKHFGLTCSLDMTFFDIDIRASSAAAFSSIYHKVWGFWSQLGSFCAKHIRSNTEDEGSGRCKLISLFQLTRKYAKVQPIRYQTKANFFPSSDADDTLLLTIWRIRWSLASHEDFIWRPFSFEVPFGQPFFPLFYENIEFSKCCWTYKIIQFFYSIYIQ